MHKVLHKKSQSTVTERMDPNEEAHTNSPSSSTSKLYHSLECILTLMISCLSVQYNYKCWIDLFVYILWWERMGGGVQMKTLIVEDLPDYLKVLYSVSFLHRLHNLNHLLFDTSNKFCSHGLRYFYSVLDINCTDQNNCQSVSVVIQQKPVNLITH